MPVLKVEHTFLGLLKHFELFFAALVTELLGFQILATKKRIDVPAAELV